MIGEQLTKINVAGEESVRLLAVDVGVVGVGGPEGGGRVGEEVVEERPLLAAQHVARQRAEVALLQDAQRRQLRARDLPRSHGIVHAERLFFPWLFRFLRVGVFNYLINM